eukprot:12881073-Prorocentrum_lima.AAC.1
MAAQQHLRWSELDKKTADALTKIIKSCNSYFGKLVALSDRARAIRCVQGMHVSYFAWII